MQATITLIPNAFRWPLRHLPQGNVGGGGATDKVPGTRKVRIQWTKEHHKTHGNPEIARNPNPRNTTESTENPKESIEQIQQRDQ